MASHVPATTALRVIAMLETVGEVERLSCPHDGRIVLIALTTLGRARVEHALSAMIEAEERIFSPHRAAMFWPDLQAQS